jgi:hypothetical protein
MPEVFAATEPWEEHEHFNLGPPIFPSRAVLYGRLYAPGSRRALLDCLLTSATVADARDRSHKRFAAAGLRF